MEHRFEPTEYCFTYSVRSTKRWRSIVKNSSLVRVIALSRQVTGDECSD